LVIHTRLDARSALLFGSLGFEAQDFVLRTSTSGAGRSSHGISDPETAANPPATATRYDECRLR